MTRRIGIAAIVSVWLLQACIPELPVIQKRETVLVGISQSVAQQALDSIYYYTGFRPDSLVLAKGIMRLAMPAESMGNELYTTPHRCDGPGIPFGVVQRLAQEAWRNAGQRVGADTVVVTVGSLTIEDRVWGGRAYCSGGGAMIRIEPDQLRGSN